MAMAETCETSHSLQLELTRSHRLSSKSRDKGICSTTRSLWKDVDKETGEELELLAKSTTQRQVVSTAWISISSMVWSHFIHSTQAPHVGLFIWDTVHGPWKSYRSQTRLGNFRQQTVFQLQATLSLPPAFPPHKKKRKEFYGPTSFYKINKC